MAEPFATAEGVVESFDDHAGAGTVRDTDGGEWYFHCTAIADGTRSIAVGASVTFQLIAGHLGRWEAAGLRPIG